MTHHRSTYRSNLPYHSPPMNDPHTYKAASTSQLPLSADVPDLYHEQGYRTPSSVTSSDMLPTPPRHFQTPWMQEYHNDMRDSGASYVSSWQSSPMNSCQSKRPTVVPIDTNLNWALHDRTESSPMPLTSTAEFNRVRGVAGGRSSYPRTFVDSDPTMRSSFAPMPDSSALPALLLPPITPLSSYSDPYMTTRPSYPPAIATNQAPLKLHQPRPSRRIPIISLSNLASACDDFPISTHVQDPERRASDEVQSPLSVSSMPSFPAADGGDTQQQKYMLYSTNDVYSPTYGVGFGGHSGKAILCNCGCMESYTFR